MDRRHHFDWRAARAIRTFWGAAALVGLFAMHGLAGHGAMHAGHGDPPLEIAAAAAAHTHAAASMPMEATAAQAPSLTAPSGPSPDDGGLGLVGLCLAVLLVGAIAAVLLGRRSWYARSLARPVAHRGWPARARRDRDPPCLFALSIQRC